MTVADLVSASGVVTIDFNANLADIYRVDTTENITSWSLVDDVDGDGFLLIITRNTGHTIAWTGLVDAWTNGAPTINEGDTIFIPFVRDGPNWVGHTPAASATPKQLVTQSIAHSSNGTLTINTTLGHTAQVTLTANATAHTLSNINDGDVISVWYLASGGARTVDFTALTEVAGLLNPESVVIPSAGVYRALFVRVFSTTYLFDAETIL